MRAAIDPREQNKSKKKLHGGSATDRIHCRVKTENFPLLAESFHSRKLISQSQLFVLREKIYFYPSRKKKTSRSCHNWTYDNFFFVFIFAGIGINKELLEWRLPELHRRLSHKRSENPTATVDQPWVSGKVQETCRKRRMVSHRACLVILNFSKFILQCTN